MQRMDGFSLAESLAGMLLLALGWLGLGQLQVRLADSALERSAAARAWLVQTNIDEKSGSYPLTPGTFPAPPPGPDGSIEITRETLGGLEKTQVTLHWQAGGDPARNELTRWRHLADTDRFARWLLIHQAPQVFPTPSPN